VGVSKERESKNSGGKSLKLEFATTLNHQFHLRLGINPSQATYGWCRMQTFSSSTRAKKNFASKLTLIPKIPEMDHIEIKFATSSNWSKTSEKVSYLLLMCYLQKPYANFYETWLCRCRQLFGRLGSFSRRRHIKAPDVSRHSGRWYS